MKISILFLLFLLVLFSSSYAGSNKEDYELQERCGKRAEEFFHRNFGDGIRNTDDGQSIANYHNHYNKKLNKCFVLTTVTNLPKTEKENIVEEGFLIDVNENKEYGNFLGVPTYEPNSCTILGNWCNSKDEWDSLIKPYMEE